ncbi:MAG TPA: DUF481 domain-containing protein [Woeseiaceae bacterium]|nr:DUF481 domain-containing protein [Woeseiaceae bacterium]
MTYKYSTRSVLLTVLLLFSATSASAAKTDVVKLVNGDLVTGEIKSLDFGALSYSTDSMGTISIDWDDVLSAKSEQSLQVELTDGTRFFGQLVEAQDEREIRILTSSGEVSHTTEDIVRITPIESDERFLEKLDGSFSLGFQAQKSSEVYTSNVAADISYRTRKYLIGLRLNSTATGQKNADASVNQSVDLNYQVFRANRWFSDWFVGWERNDELGIQARTSAGGAYGRYLIQSNTNMFSITAGTQASRQAFTGEDPSDTVYEGRLEIRYLHRKADPSTSLNFTTQIYPLLEDFSQYRAESDFTLSWEFIDDFFLSLGLSYSYTSNPPTGAAKSDYSATTSLGYSF